MSPKISPSLFEEKRDVILESAYQCFSQKGYYKTSIDDIANFAEISKGAIYTYFSSKEEIFLSIMERKTQQAFLELFYQFGQLDTANMKLRYLINSDFPFKIIDDRWSRVQFEFLMYSMDQKEFQKAFQEQKNRFLEIIKDTFEEGKKNGEFSEDLDSEIMALLFWAIKDGLALFYLDQFKGDVYKKALRKIEEIFIPK